MAHRFYVPTVSISEGVVSFSRDQRSQIRNVLRLREGDGVLVFDGTGKEYSVCLGSLDADAVGCIMDEYMAETESPVRLTLVQSLPKGEKIDLILQKCTELGVAEFLIMETERTVPHISREKLPSRLDRWQSIIIEACEQSGRVRVPTLDGVLSLKSALDRTRGAGPVLIAWEGEKWNTLSSSIVSTDRAILIVGPEGGFTQQEVATATQAGATPVSLGPRTLRAETAAIVGSSLIISDLERKLACG